MILEPDFPKRTLETAREVLRDIPECRDAEYQFIVFADKTPGVLLKFSLPQTVAKPILAIALATRSRSRPLDDGILMGGDKMRRHIRESTEHYLTKNGVKLPMFTD